MKLRGSSLSLFLCRSLSLFPFLSLFLPLFLFTSFLFSFSLYLFPLILRIEWVFFISLESFLAHWSLSVENEEMPLSLSIVCFKVVYFRRDSQEYFDRLQNAPDVPSHLNFRHPSPTDFRMWNTSPMYIISVEKEEEIPQNIFCFLRAVHWYFHYTLTNAILITCMRQPE